MFFSVNSYATNMRIPDIRDRKSIDSALQKPLNSRSGKLKGPESKSPIPLPKFGEYRVHSYGYGERTCVYPRAKGSSTRRSKPVPAPCKDGIGLLTASGDVFKTHTVAAAWSGFRSSMEPFDVCMRIGKNRPAMVTINDRKLENGAAFDLTPGAVKALVPGAQDWKDLPTKVVVLNSSSCIR